jgi:predicted phosphodiesterase
MKRLQFDKGQFLTDCKAMTNAQMGKKYGCHPRTIAWHRSNLRADGISVPNIGAPKKKLSPAEMKAFIKDTFTMGTSALTAKWDLSRTSVINYKSDLRLKGHAVGYGGFPGPLGRSFTDQLHLDLPSFITIGDCEIPDHDPSWFEIVVALGEAWNIKNLIINGDFVALDSLSAWMRQLARHTVLEDELDATKQALTAFRQQFDNIYYLMGNHERRLPHAIEGQLSFKSQVKEVYGVTVSDYPYCWVTSNSQSFLICHQDNYSRIPLSVPLQLSNIYRHNIIAGHTHRLAEGWSKSGEHRLIEGGHMRDLEKTAYKALRLNTHPAWTQGCVMVIDGIPWALDREKATFFLSLKQDEKG